MNIAQCKGTNCSATDGISHSRECIAEHDAICNAAMLADARKCSVPMWCNGMPAGTCDRPAFGPRPESKRWFNYSANEWMREDGRYNGYVPGWACEAHGGPASVKETGS